MRANLRSSSPLPCFQEPSVTMLDWSTGLGTAKYWVNDLLLGAFAQGGWAMAVQGRAPTLTPNCLLQETPSSRRPSLPPPCPPSRPRDGCTAAPSRQSSSS